jgi:predicted transcriptional regulator
MEISRFLVHFLSQDSDTAKTSGLAECANAVSKTNLGRSLLMLTCMKPRLLWLQKSTNDSAWGIGVELGTAGPGFTSTTPEEQRRSRMRVGLKAIRTGRLVRSEQRRSRMRVGLKAIRTGRLVRSEQRRSRMRVGLKAIRTGRLVRSEQRRSRVRVRLKAIRTGHLVRSEQRVKGAGFWK